MKAKVLFVAGNVSSFDATPIKIYDYLRATSHLLKSPTLLAILDVRSFFNRERKKEIKAIFSASGIRLVYTVRILPVSLLSILALYSFGRFKKIYVNNLTAGINGYVLKKLLNLQYVFDFHGSIPEERVLIGWWKPTSFRYKIARGLERRIASASAANVAVSSQALRYLGCNGEQKHNLVIPCGINFDPASLSFELRKQYREKLDVADRFVVLYSGSISPWNDYPLMASAIKHLRDACPRFLLLLLTRDPLPVVQSFINQMSLSEGECKHVSVSHADVHLYTSCADLALLLRKNSVVNQISSPMKFGEYIGAGVPVLISAGIGDASAEVAANNLGLVVSGADDFRKIPNLVNRIRSGRADYFERNRSFALQQYKLSSVLDKYRVLYNS